MLSDWECVQCVWVDGYHAIWVLGWDAHEYLMTIIPQPSVNEPNGFHMTRPHSQSAPSLFIFLLSTLMDPQLAESVNKFFRVSGERIVVDQKNECTLCDKILTTSATKLKAHLPCTIEVGISRCPNVPKKTQISIRDTEAKYPRRKVTLEVYQSIAD